MKKKNKVLCGVGIVVAMVPLIAFGTSETYSIKSPSVSAVTQDKSSEISKIKNKMMDAIFNYETLKATYVENDKGIVTTTEMHVDYKNNRAVGILKDEQGNSEMQFLIKNKKQLQYNFNDNSYYEAQVINEKRIKQERRSYKVNNQPAVGLSENPLAMPFGRASIAIEPEQYALGLMRDSESVLKGQTEFLNRPVDIMEILLPDNFVEKSGSDTFEFYIDQQTGAILKFTQSLNDKTIYQLQATEFKVNEDIDNDVFKLEIPKDANQIKDF